MFGAKMSVTVLPPEGVRENQDWKRLKHAMVTITDVRAVPGDSAFLIDSGKTAVLYDSGFAFTGCAVAENIRRVLGSRPLDYILLSHSHYDHVLGSPYIVNAYPGARVVAGEYADRIFRKASARAVMRQMNDKAARGYGASDWEDRIDELKVDITVTDGDVIDCGDLRFTAIALPGHTKCSVGYYLAEEKLLLSVETLGVYVGNQTYLPSFLVGYEMTLSSLRKARQLDIQRILLPHYGVVDREEAQAYLAGSEEAVKENARKILALLQAGQTAQQILACLKQTDYRDNVRPVYPIDAYILNTGIMIEQVRKELMPETE